MSDYEKVAEACFVLREFCVSAGIEKKICCELELCLTEALNNIIKHAYKEDNSKTIHVLISITEFELEIKLTDTGSPRLTVSEPSLVYDPKDINSLPEGGMGLFIIKNLMDSADYNTSQGINTFIMKKNVQPHWN